jgi:eukaryotic-like serine/threonine-protein kinase
MVTTRRPRPGRPRPGTAWAAVTLTAVLATVAVALITRPPAAPTAAAGDRPRPTRSARPAWTRYRDASGFSVSLPPGWRAATRTADGVHFTGPPAGFVLFISWTRHPRGSQLADWRQQAVAKATADPTYRQLAVRSVSYRGYQAADWQFSNAFGGHRVRVTDLGFVVTPGRLAYAIELYGPPARWSRIYSALWAGVLASFTPA